MIDFSIIFPTRGRQQLLKNLLKSISSTAADLSRIEVLIAIDSDDIQMQQFTKANSYSFVKFYSVPRSLNFSKDYYSYLAKVSTGRWVIACNDDCEFQTKDWDKKAKEKLEAFTNGKANIVYGWIEDMLSSHRLTQFGNYCCFPLLGRDGIEALGYFFPDDIPTWGADIWVEKVYRNIGRVCQLPIVIKHISHHNGLRKQDEISKRIAMNQVTCSMNPRYDQINKLIAAIQAPKKELVNA